MNIGLIIAVLCSLLVPEPISNLRKKEFLLLDREELSITDSLKILNVLHNKISTETLIEEYYLVEGNSPVHQAEIVFFPEIHTSTPIVINNMLLALTMASKSDQLLFEGDSGSSPCDGSFHTRIADHYYSDKVSVLPRKEIVKEIQAFYRPDGKTFAPEAKSLPSRLPDLQCEGWDSPGETLFARNQGIAKIINESGSSRKLFFAGLYHTPVSFEVFRSVSKSKQLNLFVDGTSEDTKEAYILWSYHHDYKSSLTEVEKALQGKRYAVLIHKRILAAE